MRRANILAAIVLLAVFLISGCTKSIVNEEQTNEDIAGPVKEFKIEAFQFGFDPAIIEVNQGDRVRIIASSRDVPHGFAIDEYGVNLYLNGLGAETAEFTADKLGTFAFYCNVPCGSGHGAMKGKLIVK